MSIKVLKMFIDLKKANPYNESVKSTISTGGNYGIFYTNVP